MFRLRSLRLPLRLFTVLAIAPLLGGAIGTGGCGSKGGAADAGAPIVDLQTPVPAPVGHLADLFVAAPGVTWAKARKSIGGAALFLPQAFGSLVCTLVGIPVTFAAEIDDAVPLVGAAVRRGLGPTQATVGIHVKSGDRLVDQVTRGEAARFKATVDPTSHVTLLTDKTGEPAGRVAIGVLGNYLLIGGKPADLYAIAPYVVRTVALAKPPSDDFVADFPERALSGPLLDQARETRKENEGAGASVVLVPFTGLIDMATTLLGDSTGARCTVNFDASMVHGRCTMAPKPGGPGAKLVSDLLVGDAKPILDMPDKTSVAVLWRETAAVRAANAPKQADALGRLIGSDPASDERAKITAALQAEAAARGDWQAIGAAFNGTGPTAVVRAPATDPDAMKKGIKQLLDLTELPSFKKSLAGLGVKVTAEKTVVENLAMDITRVRLARVDAKKPDDPKAKPKPDAKADPKADPKAGPAKGETPQAVDLYYYVDGGGLYAAAGFDPKESLRGIAKVTEAQSLGGSAPFVSLLGSIGSEATVVAVADILRMRAMTSGAMPPAVPSPLLVAAGRSAQGEPWARADVPTPVLQEVVQEYIRRKAAQ